MECNNDNLSSIISSKLLLGYFAHTFVYTLTHILSNMNGRRHTYTCIRQTGLPCFSAVCKSRMLQRAQGGYQQLFTIYFMYNYLWRKMFSMNFVYELP